MEMTLQNQADAADWQKGQGNVIKQMITMQVWEFIPTCAAVVNDSSDIISTANRSVKEKSSELSRCCLFPFPTLITCN
jgi:hypothetical protein